MKQPLFPDGTLLSVRIPAALATALRELANRENNGLAPFVRRVLSRAVDDERVYLAGRPPS